MGWLAHWHEVLLFFLILFLWRWERFVVQDYSAFQIGDWRSWVRTCVCDTLPVIMHPSISVLKCFVFLFPVQFPLALNQKKTKRKSKKKKKWQKSQLSASSDQTPQPSEGVTRSSVSQEPKRMSVNILPCVLFSRSSSPLFNRHVWRPTHGY